MNDLWVVVGSGFIGLMLSHRKKRISQKKHATYWKETCLQPINSLSNDSQD